MHPPLEEIEVGKEPVVQQLTQTQHPKMTWKVQGEKVNEHYQCRLHPSQKMVESEFWTEPQVLLSRA